VDAESNSRRRSNP